MNNDPPANLIRISKEEANSSHVDDLLKRQMSLHGQPGVTRERSRAWYHQTWILLMLVGMVGAISAWAIIEPYFDDLPYFRGVVTEIRPAELRLASLEDDARQDPVSAIFTIRGEQIHVLPRTREILQDGSKRRLSLDSIKTGDKIGVYLEFINTKAGDQLAIAEYVERGPAWSSSDSENSTFSQLLSRKRISGILLFPLVAGFIGLFVGAADGIICRLPRRSLLCGSVGFLVGLLGGFFCDIAAEVTYVPLTHLARQQAQASSLLSILGFAIQVFGRALAWAMVGVAMGLGQGIALRSKKLIIYGLLGGVVGGLFGGMLFDPIDQMLLGTDKVSAHWSRLIGLAVIGASVGAMIGIVELLARDTWLRMTQGPLSGKEFILFKDVMNIGASPRSDIYLFNDPLVAGEHARVRTVGDECEIESCQPSHPILLNNNATRRARLRHGDTVGIGRTIFVFQRRRG